MYLDLKEADSRVAVPRIAGIGAPIAISQTEERIEGKILGQVGLKGSSDIGQYAD